MRIVNNRTLTTISDQPNHLSPIIPFSFLGQQLSPNTPWCELHDQRDFRKDYLFYATLPHLVLVGVDEILSAYFTGQNKWRELKKNLVPCQLVLVMDSADLLSKRAYRLEQVHHLHPELCGDKEIVHQATVPALQRNAAAGNCEIEYVLRNISKLAPV